MAQTYTLDEAAQRLGIPAEEFKRRLRDEWKNVRSFRDGATLRFRAADIDELARTLGQASDPGLPLGAAPPLTDSSDELPIAPAPKSKPKPSSSGKLNKEQPVFLADDSDDIFTLPSDGPKSKPKSGGKGDSDVRLDATPKRSDVGGNQPTEEIDLELPPASGVGLGKSSAKLTAPKSSGRVNRIPGPSDGGADDGSSEFELSLDSDSDSFELQLSNDSSEESALGGDLPASGGAQSGINLGRPSDSGVNLEKKNGSKPAADDSDGDFELSLDPQSGGAPASKPIRPLTSDDEGSSEFELTLDDSGSESMNQLASEVQQGGDIFETDFELPVMGEEESGSEVLQVDGADTDLENSDFDLAIDPSDAPADDESASQVVLMDDEPMMVDDDVVAVDDDVVAVDDEEDMATALGRRESRGAMQTEVVEKVVAPPPPKWGLVPVLALAPTFLVVVLGGLMAFEVVRSMAGYQQPASAPIARGVAGMFGLKTGD
ncbi:MAG: hypothetical protein MUF18_11890 [Fimbriiglobus sp.]|jgi:hypothetical protein|nr:hypothetical protein [Fimbriiglobus sp.]